MFGQILRKSEFKGNATYQKAILLANEGIGKDRHGYRKEFVRLAESIEQLTKQKANKDKMSLFLPL